MDQKPYSPKHKIRIVTAASLFDGHDAAINIMRRIIQSTGCEVIHLGHDRSVEEVVDCAIQEDAQAIAMTSYQGGHNEYFKYMYDLLKEKNASHIKIFGGGGGTILPEEIEDLHQYGIARIYHPDDGRAMGLQGMINDLVEKADFPTGAELNGQLNDLNHKNYLALGQVISSAENYGDQFEKDLDELKNKADKKETPALIYVMLAPIFMMVGVIEIISICFRPVSLSFRLFGNVFGGENLLTSMTGMVPYLVPIPFYFYEVLVGVIQALIFTLLVAIYIGLMTNHEEEAH